MSIVDIGLPGLTGFELARHARAAGYAGRMIALSGYGAERDAQEALVAGFDAYLSNLSTARAAGEPERRLKILLTLCYTFRPTVAE